MDNHLPLPDDVKFIIDNLEKNGYQAYIVGGCVRDSLLGRIPSDWDITTDARPDEIRKLFQKTIDTGIKHGTITVLVNDGQYEITTFRYDGDYSDNRRPDSVSYTKDIKEDLSRRDFTINAMAYNPQSGIIDLYGGIADISSKIIRCVGNPDKRFEEDALRMLRAFRFSAKLGFDVEDQTINSIAGNKKLIKKISNERIRDELTGIIMSDPLTIKNLHETGILKVILPELEICFNTPQNTPYHIYNVGEHSIIATTKISNSKTLRWAMLLHDTGKPHCRTTRNGVDHFYGHAEKSASIANAVLKRMKFDNNSISKIVTLISNHSAQIKPEGKIIRKYLNKLGAELLQELIELQVADNMAKSPAVTDKKTEMLQDSMKLIKKETCSGNCYSLNTLAINGSDLLSIGFNKGPELGKTLSLLLQDVISYPEHNEKSYLIKAAADHLMKLRC